MGVNSVGGVSAGNYQNSVSTSAAKPVAEAQEVPSVEEIVKEAEANQLASDYSNLMVDSDTSKQNSNTTMKDVQEFNKLINHNTIAEFGYNEPTNRITIKIKDKETDEVIKEIPSEKALEMLARAWELAGLIVDEKR